jgi:hypothetical protein
MRALRNPNALASAAVAVAVAFVVACSAPFAPADVFDGGDEVPPTAPDATGSDEASASDGSVPVSDTAVNDATDATDDGPLCTGPKLPNDAGCTVASDCCSDACTSNHTCKDHCVTSFNACSTAGSDCCVGSYCSFAMFGKCASCRPAGADAEVFGSVVLATSCCTGRVDTTTRKCAI